MIRARGSDAAVRRLSAETLAVVLAGGSGARLGALTALQTPAAVPFGGQYRAIDFTLSNCVNSEIRRIALLTQYKSQSLIRHVQRGWSFFHRPLGEFVEIWPAQQRDGERWYGGTIDAIHQNLDLIEAAEPKYVIVLAADQIYALDYADMLERHADSGADATLACVERSAAEASGHEVAALDRTLRIERIGAPARRGGPRFVPIGACVFDTAFLRSQIADWRRRSAVCDLARDLLPQAARDAYVVAHVVRDGPRPGYWRELDTVERYWRAHMELLDDAAPAVLNDPEWPIFTSHEPLPPAQIRAGAKVDTAVVSPGCLVAGEVAHSVLSTGCTVDPGATVRDCVLLPGARVGSGCMLERVVVDSNCAVAPGTVLGSQRAGARSHYVSPRGVVLVAPPAASASGDAARKIA